MFFVWLERWISVSVSVSISASSKKLHLIGLESQHMRFLYLRIYGKKGGFESDEIYIVCSFYIFGTHTTPRWGRSIRGDVHMEELVLWGSDLVWFGAVEVWIGMQEEKKDSGV